MAVFPSLNPSSSRTYSPGDYPHTVYTGLSGDESRVRHSSVMTGSEVRLSFSGLSEADMLSILSHYQGQVGAYYAFTLPSISFAGMADATVFTLSRYQWRYQAAPVVRDLPCGTHTVDVQLVSVAPEPVATQGARLVVVASVALTPVVTTSGLNAMITASIEHGAAEAAGLAQTVTITLAAGSATGNTEALGAIFIVPLILLGGTAAAANGLDRAITVSIAGGTATGGSDQTGLTQTVTLTLAAGAASAAPAPSVLLHFDGINNSTSFVDSSLNALAFTALGDAKISTTQSKFGGASGYFDGNGDRIQAQYASAFDVVGSSFTVEAWVYPQAVGTDGTRIASSCGGNVAYNSTNGIHWLFQLVRISGIRYAQLQINGASATQGITSTATLSLSTWTHVCACVNGSTIYVGVGGTVNSATIGTLSRPSTNPRLEIGSIYGENGNSLYAFNGFIDEFRLIKGQALYTANFTPPTAAFPNP